MKPSKEHAGATLEIPSEELLQKKVWGRRPINTQCELSEEMILDRFHDAGGLMQIVSAVDVLDESLLLLYGSSDFKNFM